MYRSAPEICCFPSKYNNIKWLKFLQNNNIQIKKLMSFTSVSMHSCVSVSVSVCVCVCVCWGADKELHFCQNLYHKTCTSLSEPRLLYTLPGTGANFIPTYIKVSF